MRKICQLCGIQGGDGAGRRAGAVGAEAVLDWVERHGGDRAEFEKFL